ncbi:MAG: immunity 26/phosphotriesterase HocA family protein [Aeriscardovia sp.]|nr:immunity 26/phosphotriesterase HocA family protein [Aeriscardovia sp.]MBR3463040.1 immunity 26/phosphotriesterase HocA family protein [Clostridiales bacterium]
MELTNEQRKCFGLELVDPSWERKEIPSNAVHPERSDGVDILYFDGDILRKVVNARNSGGFRESAYNLKTQDDRTMIAPITSKGKPKRLNGVNIARCSAHGTYIDVSINKFGTADVLVGNYDTQRTYYSSHMACVKLPWEEFLAKWTAETTEKDLAEVEEFSSAGRKHCKFKEGDFFRFKFDRRNYGYGRILFDVHKWVKSGGAFWNVLMTRPVCVSIYHIVTEDPDVSIEELSKLDSCPSEYVMDNIFFYGDCEIIGNAPLPDEIDYPIMYGRSISALDRDKICLCIGRLYKELPLKGNENPGRKFMNNSIGFWPHIDMNIVKACEEAKSNEPYWEPKRLREDWGDIRDPIFAKEYKAMMKQFGL